MAFGLLEQMQKEKLITAKWMATLPLGLVIGSEGKGMSRLIREKCDFLYHLPMVGHVTSLNASVAAAFLCMRFIANVIRIEG